MIHKKKLGVVCFRLLKPKKDITLALSGTSDKIESITQGNTTTLNTTKWFFSASVSSKLISVYFFTFEKKSKDTILKVNLSEIFWEDVVICLQQLLQRILEYIIAFEIFVTKTSYRWHRCAIAPVIGDDEVFCIISFVCFIQSINHKLRPSFSYSNIGSNCTRNKNLSLANGWTIFWTINLGVPWI